MQIVFLSGGSGKRLWPLSNNARSKQFLPLLETEDGRMESMVQRVVRQCREARLEAQITFATNAAQRDSIINQLGTDVDIVAEPERRDTFPAIALAASYLHFEKRCPDDEVVVVMPSDPYTEIGYFETINKMSVAVRKNAAELVLMGITPTYPSEKYGYIVPVKGERLTDEGLKVQRFTEKPSVEVAKELLSAGALWNGGVFAYKLSYVLNKSTELLGTADYQTLFNTYDTLKKISFDYAVVEQETSFNVLKYSGTWKDLGTWNTITEAMQRETIGDVTMVKSKNTSVINELKIPVLAMGLNNVVVAASPDGILVADKNESSYMKPYVENIMPSIMYSEKSWGEYKVIDVQNESLTILVTLKAGNKMKYHSHDNRDETWTVISGVGRVILDGIENKIKAGDVIKLQRGVKHTAIADEELKMIEVQLGKDINREDKKVYQLK